VENSLSTLTTARNLFSPQDKHNYWINHNENKFLLSCSHLGTVFGKNISISAFSNVENKPDFSTLRKPTRKRSATGEDGMDRLNRENSFSLHDIRVVLNYAPLGFVQAVTERIGHHQIQLNTGKITLNHNAEVEIVMSIPGREHSEHHRISAQVSHCDEGGNAILNFHCCGKKTMLALLPYLTRH
jgi:hypothetical protein